ncbi:hypothetical protein LSAT2_018055 [Lamellibrachia satsuma]|nr:hypothetical protein LSAT2_018055 [Lamellibrachia satsuma]
MNIASLCYIPVQCDLVCRTVRAKKNSPSEQLPETITQLYTMAVTNLVHEHHPLFKGKEVEDDVVGQLSEPLLNHAKLARSGMGESPVKVTFSKTDIEALHLEKSSIECGLLTFTKEKRESVVRKYSCVYSFTHLTMQEWLSAVALVSSRENTESMIMKSANDGQLDLVLMFLCGLVGDQMNKEFLDSLDCRIRMTAEHVLELVVQREREKTGKDHKQSVLLILLLLFESRRPELWSSVSGYVMQDGKTLNLSGQHISPVELQAVTFIFHIGDFNSLDLGFCRLSGRETRRLAGAISMLTRLQSLRLGYNDFSDPTTGEALAESLLKLNTLKKLSRCLHRSPLASLICLNYRLPHLSSVAPSPATPLPCYTSGLLPKWPATPVAYYY